MTTTTASTSDTMTPGSPLAATPMTDAVLATRTSEVLAALDAKINALDEGDEPRPNARQRIAEQRAFLQGLRHALRHALDSWGRTDPTRYEDLTWWHQQVQACITEFETALAAAEARPQAERARHFREEDALRQSLVILQRGPDALGYGLEALPSRLAEWFQAHGIQPVAGQRGYFAARGGLQSVKVRLADFAAQRISARTELEQMLAEASTD